MFDNNPFDGLDLTNTEFEDRKRVMQPGKHIAKITKAAIKKTPDGRQQVEVHFENSNGDVITEWYTTYNPKSSDNARIGREKFKAMLVYAGHANPNKPGDAPIEGLTVGIMVEKRVYTSDGKQKEALEVKYTTDPYNIDPVNFPIQREIPQMAKQSDGLSDGIPF